MIAHQRQDDLAFLALELQPVQHRLRQLAALRCVVAAPAGLPGVMQQQRQQQQLQPVDLLQQTRESAVPSPARRRAAHARSQSSGRCVRPRCSGGTNRGSPARRCRETPEPASPGRPACAWCAAPGRRGVPAGCAAVLREETGPPAGAGSSSGSASLMADSARTVSREPCSAISAKTRSMDSGSNVVSSSAKIDAPIHQHKGCSLNRDLAPPPGEEWPRSMAAAPAAEPRCARSCAHAGSKCASSTRDPQCRPFRDRCSSRRLRPAHASSGCCHRGARAGAESSASPSGTRLLPAPRVPASDLRCSATTLCRGILFNAVHHCAAW